MDDLVKFVQNEVALDGQPGKSTTAGLKDLFAPTVT